MFDALRRMLADNEPANDANVGRYSNDVRMAACVLLVELASVDGDFSAVERQRILDILQRHFGVDGVEAEQLLAEAAAASRNSVDDFVFTRQVVKEYDLAQRMVLAELMWQVVLADGTVDGNESYLMRKLANLLQLEPAFLAQARRRTEEGAG